MALKSSMPQFVARCLEEIGLEGRCGMPLRELFHAVDPEDDMAYRRYAWKDKTADMKPLIGGRGVSTPRRKRKWKTTLLNSPSGDSPALTTRSDEADKTPKRQKHKHQHLQPVLPSMRRIAAQKQRRRLSDVDSGTRGDKSDCASRVRRRRQGSNEQQQRDEEVKKEVKDAADDTQWVLRSPRGFRLGEEVDVGGLSYDEAVTSNQDGVLGVVACEDLRLKYLGVQDSSSIDTISPQFDLLEIIGRAKVRGENAAVLTNSRLFGDSRKLHYLLDMLIGSNYVVKNIVTADQRRFNMVHLRRFACKFHASMVSPSAIISQQVFPKEVLAQVIVGMMKARGERTCVFADIGRELGYGKRHQEQLRNYFMQQMRAKPSFPLQLFMARCKTGNEYIGRKLC
uniref:B-block binding subunit of TFIIIC domain-containing protein n=1 Tax=Phytophthora ramorum TaxID=164328 RepID=H3HC04_PHYRM